METIADRPAEIRAVVSDHVQGDDFDLRRRRALFRCWNRGTQESDLIFGSFAETFLPVFNSSQLERFEALLECTDPDLFDWVLGGYAPAARARSRHDAAALSDQFFRSSLAVVASGHSNPFRYFKSSPEIIRLAVRMYVKPLSLRNVEDLLAERGIDISHETVRFWWNRFGPRFAAKIRKKRVAHMRGYPQWRWHLDEAFVKANGKLCYLWRAVDRPPHHG